MCNNGATKRKKSNSRQQTTTGYGDTVLGCTGWLSYMTRMVTGWKLSKEETILESRTSTIIRRQCCVSRLHLFSRASPQDLLWLSFCEAGTCQNGFMLLTPPLHPLHNFTAEALHIPKTNETATTECWLQPMHCMRNFKSQNCRRQTFSHQVNPLPPLREQW